ncbi:MAG: MurR/RpiR family transcriptional regulator [Lachnospiraceae bacterium]
MNDVLETISNAYPTLSKGHKKIANYILESFEDVIFMTALEVAHHLEVSESTVVRFSQKIGLEGYPELLVALRTLGKDKLQKAQPPKVTEKEYDDWGVIASVLQSDMNKIHETLQELSADVFGVAIDTILEAKHVYILGLRNCAPLASFLHFYLNVLRPDVILLNSNSASEIYEHLFRINSEDVIVGISFPRYSMQTIKAMELANDKGAKVIAITDDKHSPVNLYSSINLFAKSEMTSVAESLVAPLSLLNAIVVALCLRNPERAVKQLRELEDISSEYQILEKDDINYMDEKIDFTVKHS